MTMNTNRSLCALGLMLLLGACNQVRSYSDAEAPKDLKLDTATSRYDVRFAPGSAVIAAPDAARLRQIAANGGIARGDRVLVAAAGSPTLAELRVAAVSAVLLNYGVVADADQLAQIPRERAIIQVNRTLVTLPACPNWSKNSAYNFENQASSNFGCADQVDLGRMVANPADLASGLPSNGVAAQPSTAAVNRYLNDKVYALPSATTANAFSAAGGTSNGASTTSSGSQ
jgi:pilus assembly protein CpaD